MQPSFDVPHESPLAQVPDVEQRLETLLVHFEAAPALEEASQTLHLHLQAISPEPKTLALTLSLTSTLKYTLDLTLNTDVSSICNSKSIMDDVHNRL